MLRRCIAEFIGTLGLVVGGTGAIMADHLSGGQVTHLGIGVSFGLVVGAMIYAVGHISGAHINPALTLGFALVRHFPWREVPFYWIAQLSGAVAASLLLRAILGRVGEMGATVPSVGLWQSLATEVLLTFFLMFVIMAVATDVRAEGQAAAIAIGATVGLASIFAGPISGASMNPARSFGPALMAGAWTSHWVYWAGPALGAGAGSLVYRWLKGAEGARDYEPRRRSGQR